MAGRRNKLLQVEVVYAMPHEAKVMELSVTEGTSIGEAIEQSGILQACPEVDLDRNKVGVFSKLKKLNDRVKDSDRIEIYRSLKADPKEARRNRAAEQKTP